MKVIINEVVYDSASALIIIAWHREEKIDIHHLENLEVIFNNRLHGNNIIQESIKLLELYKQ